MLAGFWMVATHVGLLSQAQEGIVTWGSVAWHATPGVAVSMLGVTWMIRFWSPDAERVEHRP